jgi:hypothetical protein
MTAILALRRQKQEEFEARLNYIMIPCLKKKKNCGTNELILKRSGYKSSTPKSVVVCYSVNVSL